MNMVLVGVNSDSCWARADVIERVWMRGAKVLVATVAQARSASVA